MAVESGMGRAQARPERRWAAFVLVALLGGCDGCGEDEAVEPVSAAAASEVGVSEVDLLYTVDASRPGEERVRLELRVRALPRGKHVFVASRPAKEIAVTGVAAEDGGGRPLPVEQAGTPERPAYAVEVGEGAGPVRLRWTVGLVGSTRHGRIGYLSDRFGLLPGGIFLVPRDDLAREREQYRGETDRLIRVRVHAPDGWQVASTMADAGQGFDPAVAGKWPVTHLQHANLALGRFERFDKRTAGVLHRVYVFADWPEHEKRSIADRAWRIYRVFQAQAPCGGLPTYTNIFVPAGAGKEKITGDYWSTGQAFAFDAYPEERRVWELVAHRMAHAVNRYEVCGTHIDDPLERWFVEGWASWTEVTHLLSAGIVQTETRFEQLGNYYRNVYLGLFPRHGDAPVVEEATTDHEPLKLYLHYTKGPLVVQQLEYEMRRLSGGDKGVNDFVEWLYPKYRGHRRSIALFDELERYMGRSMDWFRDRYVTRTSTFYPLHRSFLARLRSESVEGDPATPVLRVGDHVWTRREHEELERFLGVTKLHPSEDSEDVARRMILVDQEYERRGATFVPPVIRENAAMLPASVRYLMYRHQVDELFDDRKDYQRWLRTAGTRAGVGPLGGK